MNKQNKKINLIDSQSIIKQQDNKKLQKTLLDAKKELFNLRCQKAMSEIKDTSRFKKVRKKVARVHTEITKRFKLNNKKIKEHKNA